MLNPERTEYLVGLSPYDLTTNGRPALTLGNLPIAASDSVRNIDCVFDRHMTTDAL